MKYDSKSDRDNLELMIYLALTAEQPMISISKGRELLDFETMDEMRNWFDAYDDNAKRATTK